MPLTLVYKSLEAEERPLEQSLSNTQPGLTGSRPRSLHLRISARASDRPAVQLAAASAALAITLENGSLTRITIRILIRTTRCIEG